jgi:DNA-binding MarR family transcriptional regulator
MHQEQFDAVLVAIRRIIRAIDLQSRKLVQSHGLTGPQALILKEVSRNQGLTAGELARNVSLSQATITDIVKRLELRGLLTRERYQEDRRRTIVSVTAEGEKLLAQSPPLLQEQFAKRFSELKDWEQSQLLYSVQRLASLMDAEELDASPVLASGSMLASAQAVEDVLAPEEVLEEGDA